MLLCRRSQKHDPRAAGLGRTRRGQLAARLKIQPAPARISKLDFDEICDSFAISPQKNRGFLRAMVDSSTDFVADFVKQQASQPQLRDDRKSVKDAISALEKVRRLLDRVGP